MNDLKVRQVILRENGVSLELRTDDTDRNTYINVYSGLTKIGTITTDRAQLSTLMAKLFPTDYTPKHGGAHE